MLVLGDGEAGQVQHFADEEGAAGQKQSGDDGTEEAEDFVGVRVREAVEAG